MSGTRVTPGDVGNGSVRNRPFRAERNRPTLLLHRIFSSVDPSLSVFLPRLVFSGKKKEAFGKLLFFIHVTVHRNKFLYNKTN
jgi:hypothetical protein